MGKNRLVNHSVYIFHIFAYKPRFAPVGRLHLPIPLDSDYIPLIHEPRMTCGRGACTSNSRIFPHKRLIGISKSKSKKTRGDCQKRFSVSDSTSKGTSIKTVFFEYVH